MVLNMNYFSKNEVAKKLRVSNRTVDNWMADGKISFTKVGRKVIFSDDDLESLIRNFHRDAFYYQKQYQQKLNNYLEYKKETNF
jgi:excisionase family DNA binding protein